MSMDEEPLTDLTGQEAPGKEEFHICTELSDFPVSDCPAFLRIPDRQTGLVDHSPVPLFPAGRPVRPVFPAGHPAGCRGR